MAPPGLEDHLRALVRDRMAGKARRARWQQPLPQQPQERLQAVLQVQRGFDALLGGLHARWLAAEAAPADVAPSPPPEQMAAASRLRWADAPDDEADDEDAAAQYTQYYHIGGDDDDVASAEYEDDGYREDLGDKGGDDKDQDKSFGLDAGCTSFDKDNNFGMDAGCDKTSSLGALEHVDVQSYIKDELRQGPRLREGLEP